MKRIFRVIFIVLLVLKLMVVANAQTIYHYKQVAKVNPDTGEKTAYYGKSKIHVIFYSTGNILQRVEENGEKISEDFKDGELKSFGFGMSSAYHYYSGNRNENEYSFIKNQNNILTYKHYHEDKIVPVSSMTNPYITPIISKFTFYIYLSPDKKRLNLHAPPDGEFRGWTEVYELYDTDEANSIPQSKKMDPNNPTMLY